MEDINDIKENYQTYHILNKGFQYVTLRVGYTIVVHDVWANDVLDDIRSSAE